MAKIGEEVVTTRLLRPLATTKKARGIVAGIVARKGAGRTSTVSPGTRLVSRGARKLGRRPRPPSKETIPAPLLTGLLALASHPLPLLQLSSPRLIANARSGALLILAW